MTSSGIELATYRLVAYFLNQLRYRVLPKNLLALTNIIQLYKLIYVI
jgi:hypothetical protein